MGSWWGLGYNSFAFVMSIFTKTNSIPHLRNLNTRYAVSSYCSSVTCVYFTGDFEFVSTSSDWLHHIEARLINTVLVVKLGRRQFLLQRSNVCVLYRNSSTCPFSSLELYFYFNFYQALHTICVCCHTL